MPTLFDLHGIDLNEEAPQQPEKAGFLRRAVGDTGISLVKGAIGVPEAIVGVADLATGGQAGRLAEQAGFRPKEARAALDELLSPQQQAENREVQQASGFMETARAMLKNPTTIYHAAVESAPSLLPAGVVARGAMAVAPRIGGAFAAGLGEGVVSAGQTAEQVRQETADGLLTGEQSAIAGASGALTGIIGGVAGKIANKLGIGDVNQLVAGVQQAGPAAQKSFVRAMLEGFATEGVLQELPQSAQEQIAQNVALGKPWDEGVGAAAASGALAGGLMGGIAGPIQRSPAQPDPVTESLDKLAKAGTVSEMIQAAQEVVGSPTMPAGFDATRENLAMTAMERQMADDASAMRFSGGRESAQPAPTTRRAPQAQASATIVPDAPMLDRLATVQESLRDARVRDQVRQQFGEDGLNTLLYYADVANRPSGADGIPDATRERMLGLAEGLISRATLQPVAQPGAVGAAPQAQQLEAPDQVPRIGLDTTPTGRMRADATGNVAPETRADAISTAQRVNARDERLRGGPGMETQTPRDKMRGAGPGVMVGEGSLESATFPAREPRRLTNDPTTPTQPAAPKRAEPDTRLRDLPQRLAEQADPVTAYVERQRTVDTPEARQFVRDFNAGKITRRDVIRVMQEQGADPLAGKVYRTRSAASAEARKSGKVVEQVEGGFTVVEQDSGTERGIRGDAGMAAGAGAGRGDQPGGSAQPVGSRAAADAGRGDAAGLNGQRGGEDVPVRAGDSGDGALTGYTPPSGNIGSNWAAHDSRQFKPDARQQTVMDAVSAALDAGLFYNRDVERFVADKMGVTPEQRASNKSNVEGGDFGYDVYYARRAVERKRQNVKDDLARDGLNLKAGDVVGTVVFNDGKINTNVVVESVEDDGWTVKLRGKRGAYTVTMSTSPTNIKHAIDRAKERGKRKDDADEFIERKRPVSSSTTRVDAAATEAATSPSNDLPEPTDAQKEAGNYKKGHVRISGMDVAISLPNPWEISQDEFVRLVTFAKEGSTAFPWAAKWGDRILEAENEEYDHPDLGKTIVQGRRFSKTKREAETIARGAHKRAVRRAALNGETPTAEALKAYPDLQPAQESPAEQPAASRATADAWREQEFVHNGVRIYPTTVNVGGERKAMWGVESAENKAKREAGERHGFGDSLFATQEQARAAADRQIQRDAERAEFERRKTEIEAEKQAEIAARKADTINGFLDGKAPNTQELIRKALDKQYRFDGVIRSVRKQVEWLDENGTLEVGSFDEPKIKPMSRTQFNRATQREQDAHEKKMREAGTKTVYLVSGSEIGKYAYDYAQHLIARKNSAVQQPAQPEQPAKRYAGPADVSSRAGQMELANRGGTIAALKAMNAQLRAIAPEEAWADANIEDAADLDALRDQISVALVRANRAGSAEQDSPLRKRLEEASGADLRAVFDALGLAGGARMIQADRVKALMSEDAQAVSDALDDVQSDGEPAAAEAPAQPPAANQPALTGSDSPADVASAAGQGGLFDSPAKEAANILDAAEVTGKERIDALKDIKAGTITTEELKDAYPAKIGARLDDLDAKFSAAAAADKNLIITHNLTAQNLLHAVKMGGLPVPSLAITKKDTPLTGFGEITLLGDSNLADPKGYASTKVYGADIYSPRYPSVTFEFTPNMRKRGEAILRQAMEATGQAYIEWSEVEKDGPREFERNTAFLWKFLTDKGLTPDVKRTEVKPLSPEMMPFAEGNLDRFDLMRDEAFIAAAWKMRRKFLLARYEGNEAETDAEMNAERERVKERGQFFFGNDLARQIENYRRDLRDNGKIDRDATRRALQNQVREADLSGELEAAARQFVEDLSPNERIFQGFTNSGNRKYIPHTLENVVKLLKKELRGGESFNYGVGSLRAKFTPEFKTLAAIKKEKGRLVSAEEFEPVKKEVDDELFGIATELGLSLDQTIEVFEDAPKMGVTRAIDRAIRDYNSSAIVDEEIKQRVAQFLTRLRNLPTAYFEAKILRDVSLSEFKAAVVPEGSSKEVLDALKKAGIADIKKYERGNDASRAAAIQSFEDLRFSRRDAMDSVAEQGMPAHLVERYAKQYEAAGLHRVNVARNIGDLPARLQAKMSGAGDDVRGAYFRAEDQVWLFSDRLNSMDELHFVVIHEAFHRGLGHLFGEDGRKIMRQMYATNKALRDRADLVAKELKIDRDEAIEEALADMAGEGGVESLRGWKGLVQLIRKWLQGLATRLGVPLRFSDAQIRAFVAGVAGAGLRAQKAEPVLLTRERDMVMASREGQRDQTDTREFKRWFGDSKVVDAEGKPLVVYHGTAGNFSEFSPDFAGSTTYSASGLDGFFFTGDADTASKYAKVAQKTQHEMYGRFYSNANVMPVYLALNNPLVYRKQRGDASTLMDTLKRRVIADAKAAGNDGVVFQGFKDTPNGRGDSADVYVAFSPEQIKSAIGNSGAFDASNPDIRFSMVDHSANSILSTADAVQRLIGAAPKAVGETGRKYTAKQREAMDRVGFDPAGQTDSEAFKRWFGDSRVVDAEGNPLVVYHGTRTKGEAIDSFDIEKAGSKTDSGWMGTGLYFGDQRTADAYAGHYEIDPDHYPEGGAVYPVYLSIQNPAILKDSERNDGPRTMVRELLDLADDASASEVRDGLLAAGYDGVIYERFSPYGNGYREYVAFRPEQIKSAIGNSGAFDPENADIRFSRSSTLDAINQQAIRDKVSDLFSNAGEKVSWWDKTIGTQYNKAKKHPAFKKVFDHVQQYVEDTSTLANEAADKAPAILPKLESVRDVFAAHARGLSTEDKVAVAAPIFEGTLDWARIGGKLVRIDDAAKSAEQMSTAQKARRLVDDGRVSQEEVDRWEKSALPIYEGAIRSRYEQAYLTPGVVFNRQELRDLFKLNERQIEQYEQFRSAVNESLDQVATADALRLLGESPAELRAMAMGDRAAFRAGLVDYMEERIAEEEDTDVREQLRQTMADIEDKFNRVDDMKARGYAPLMRFGKFLVSVKGAEGEQEWFSLHETKAEANKMARELQGDPQFRGRVRQGVLSEEAYKLFSSIPVESLEMFAGALGAEKSAVFQEYLRMTKNNRSALKRLIQRKGTAGFSDEVSRVLASFVTSNARLAAGAMNMPAAKEAADAIRDGDLKDEGVKLIETVQNPTDTAGVLRGLMFTHFIGGSIASALVNVTQPVMMTLPWLSQWGGGAKAASRLMASARMAAGGKIADTELAKALERAEKDGIVSPQEIHHLTAEAMATWGKNPWLKRVAFIWSAPFSVAEQFNRRVSFLAAYKTAKEEGIADPFAFAQEAVVETQGLYNKGNSANWTRNPIGATALTFKQYSVHYLEWIKRMWNAGEPGSRERTEGRRAVLLAMALLFAAGGAEGLPFAEDLDDLADTIMQALGFDTSAKGWKREFIAKTLGLGDEGADVLMRGLSAVPGIPLDVSMRMGMGNLLPGTGMLLKSTTDASRDIAELAGPAGSLLTQWKDAGKKALDGDIPGAMLGAMPGAIQNMGKAASMWMNGEARDTKGRRIMQTDEIDGFMRFLGFNPSEIARESARLSEQDRRVRLTRAVESSIADQWAQGMRDGNADAVQEARAQLQEWNDTNPESRISISSAQIKRRLKDLGEDRSARFERATPKELRGSVHGALH